MFIGCLYVCTVGAVLLVHATSKAQHPPVPVRGEAERGGRGSKIVTVTGETKRPSVPSGCAGISQM